MKNRFFYIKSIYKLYSYKTKSFFLFYQLMNLYLDKSIECPNIIIHGALSIEIILFRHPDFWPPFLPCSASSIILPVFGHKFSNCPIILPKVLQSSIISEIFDIKRPLSLVQIDHFLNEIFFRVLLCLFDRCS